MGERSHSPTVQRLWLVLALFLAYAFPACLQARAIEIIKAVTESSDKAKADAAKVAEKVSNHATFGFPCCGHAALHCQLEVDVNVFAGLAKIRLNNLPHGVVPSGPLASALATKAKVLSKKGVARPFPFEVLII